MKREVIVYGKCWNIRCSFFLDTGSTVSLISKSLVKHLQTKGALEIKSTNVTLSSFSRNSIPTHGQVTVTLAIAGVNTEWTFIISDLLDTDYLLGSDFMEQNNLSLDMGKGILRSAEGQTGFSGLPRMLEENVKIRTSNAVTIAPNKVVWIIAELPKNYAYRQTYSGVVSPGTNLAANTGLILASSVVNTEGRRIPIQCVNATDETVFLGKDKLLGTLHPIEVGRIQGVKAIRMKQSNDDQTCSVNKEHIQDKHPAWTKEKLYTDLDIENIDITEEQKSKMKELVWKYRMCFSRNSNDIGNCNFYKATIQLRQDATPKWIPSIPIPYKLKPQYDRELSKLEDSGVVQKIPKDGKSNWNSRVFLIPKPNKKGEFRFVADMRSVNQQCLPDSFELPNVNFVTDKLGGRKLYSTCDLSQSFHQVSYEKDSWPITAFSCNGKRYWYKRMIMGHKASGSHFSRMMCKLLNGIPVEHLCYFLDDLMLASDDFDSHMELLEKVLMRFAQANLKLMPGKCHFLRKEVKFVGLTISEEGVKINEERVKAILDLQPPKTAKETRSVLGVLGYNRKFIPKYASITKPLYSLLTKGSRFKWTDDCQKAFDELKTAVGKCTLLAMPDTDDPHQSYECTIDGSNQGYSGTLSQQIKGERRIVAYYSKRVPPHKKMWGQTKLEFQTLCNALDYWKIYLRGTKFVVITDCDSLMDIETIFGIDIDSATMQRKLQKLQNYDFTIRHISGKENYMTDFLSRYPYKRLMVEQSTQTSDINLKDDDQSKELAVNSIQLLVLRPTTGGEGQYASTDSNQPQKSDDHSEYMKILFSEDDTDLVQSSPGNNDSQANTDDIQCLCEEVARADLSNKLERTYTQQQHVKAISTYTIDKEQLPRLEDIQTAQEEDPILSEVRKWVQEGQKPLAVQALRTPRELVSYWKQFELLNMTDGVLRRKWIPVADEEEKNLVVIPEKLQEHIMTSIHCSEIGGHPGVASSITVCLRYYYWTDMRTDMKLFVEACTTCGRFKQPQAYLKAPLKHLLFHKFNDCIVIDHITPSTSRNPRGYRTILTITDMWSNYLVAVPCRGETAEETISVLKSRWFYKHGWAKEIISDQAPGYSSHLFNELLEAFECKVTKGSSYLARSTGRAERSNKRLDTILRTSIPEGDHDDWDLYLDCVVFTLNGLKGRHTGYSANRLVYGHELTTPLDLIINCCNNGEDDQTKTYSEVVAQRYRTTKTIITKVRLNCERDFKYADAAWSKGLKGPYFKEGELAYLLVHCPEHKFSVRWKGPVRVKKVISNHLYVVLSEEGTEKVVNISHMKRYKANIFSPSNLREEPDEQGLSQLNPNAQEYTPLPKVQSATEEMTSSSHAHTEIDVQNTDSEDSFVTAQRDSDDSDPDYQGLSESYSDSDQDDENDDLDLSSDSQQNLVTDPVLEERQSGSESSEGDGQINSLPNDIDLDLSSDFQRNLVPESGLEEEQPVTESSGEDGQINSLPNDIDIDLSSEPQPNLVPDEPRSESDDLQQGAQEQGRARSGLRSRALLKKVNRYTGFE